MEYLADHTRDLLIYIVQPRIGPHVNLLRRYHEGVLVEERPVRSSQNLFFYYLLWYMNHVRFLLAFCPRNETTLVFAGHPIVCFGMGLFRRVRPIRYAYWIGDYFPSAHPLVRLFERLKKRYHDRVDYAFYLSDAINRVMNGTVVNSPNRRTVMWGVKPFPNAPTPPLEPFTLLFVGLIRPGQGLETLFDFLATHGEYRLNVIGVCQPEYHAHLQERIDRLKIRERLFFPNRFYSESALLEVAQRSHVGLALYETTADNFTHFADPGKVKAYAEMHLPVVMTRISDIVPYVERFRSGVVIDRIDQIGEALERIQCKYLQYQEGISQFNACFEYERYYQEAFRAFPNCRNQAHAAKPR